jgi:hypothetical protein
MSTVFEMLEREWTRLGNDRAAALRLKDVCSLAAGATSLTEMEEFVRRADPVAADRVLVALVARAVEDDPLAARVLLHLLLPGTRRLARRWWALGDEAERAAAAVAAVYSRIRRYPIVRRPARVAANILLDAAQELRRAVPRVWDTVPVEHLGDTAADDDIAHPAVELADVLVDAVRCGVIGEDDAQIIARSRIGGARMADLAADRGLRPRTLWDRRQRAEKTLVASQGDSAPNRLAPA